MIKEELYSLVKSSLNQASCSTPVNPSKQNRDEAKYYKNRR